MALSSPLPCFSPAEVPCPESYRAAGEPRAFGSSANGQWRGLVPPLGSVPQKPRVSRGSYLEARKNPRCVRLPSAFGLPRGALWELRGGVFTRTNRWSRYRVSSGWEELRGSRLAGSVGAFRCFRNLPAAKMLRKGRERWF